MAIRVLIADDHEVVRSGLAGLLAGTDVEIVGQAANGRETLDQAGALHPDVVLIDVRMPEVDGLTALEQLRTTAPETRVVVLSTYDNPTYMARALALGAYDYLLKGCTRDELLHSLRTAARGDRPTLRPPLQRVVTAMRDARPNLDDDVELTQRETQILRHVALGLSNDEIGRSLSISADTVKEHVRNVLRKIGVHGRTQAAVWAVRRGLV